jgi:hypothetical protein
MFFADPEAAFGNVARSMRPHGRLTLLTWQPPQRNEWIGAFGTALLGQAPSPPPGAPGPFSMSDPQTVRTLLQGAGFADVAIDGLAEPMFFGDDVDDAHRFVLGLLGWMLEGRDERARHDASEALRTTMESHVTEHGVTFASATWLITARRT